MTPLPLIILQAEAFSGTYLWVSSAVDPALYIYMRPFAQFQ